MWAALWWFQSWSPAIPSLPASADASGQRRGCCCSLRPHGLQHARLLCCPPFPRVFSDSCPLSQWCYLNISSSATLFSFCLQSFPTSGSFPMSRIRWSKYWSFSSNIIPSSEYSGLISFRIDWFDLLGIQGTHKSLLQPHSLRQVSFSKFGPCSRLIGNKMILDVHRHLVLWWNSTSFGS